MIYPIIAYGNPVLEGQAEAIKPGTNLKRIIADLFATLEVTQGLGLAAPQIGKPWQLFVADIGSFVPDGNLYPKHYKKVYINPVLTLPQPTQLVEYEEGCLSIPGIYIKIKRSHQVHIKFFDESWQPQAETLQDMPSRIIQHEYDHLQGKLHIHYLDQAQRLAIEPSLEKIKHGEINVRYPIKFVSTLPIPTKAI
jgi:peptide deformylase